MRTRIKTVLILLLSALFILWPSSVRSASCEDSCDNESDEDKKLDCLNEVTSACESKLAEAKSKKKTLQSALSFINNQIAFTQSEINEKTFQIEQLEEKIKELSGKIGLLNISLDNITKLFINRINATYKHLKLHPILLFFSSNGFSDFINRYSYLKAAQTNDKQIMYQMELAKSNYDSQKSLKQEKQDQVLGLQTELISKKNTLEGQKSSKNKLLRETENDERKYQELLAKTRAEFEAIQNILAGGGNETEAGDVKEGDHIANIIPDASCNSSGPHLHFTVVQGDSIQNPFNYLKSTDHENCSGSDCGSSDGDSFNPGGDWNWPINSRVKFTQGYGNTWAVNNTWVGNIYSSHNGIDIFNDSLNVKAVKNGKLYRGSYVGSGGCTLRYVKVDHNDSDIETYYLHVNYK